MYLLNTERTLRISPRLAVRIGLNEAIFLQQLHYWLDKSNIEAHGCKWVYNTAEQWKENFPFWSTRTIERIVQSLKEQGLVVTIKLKSKEYDQTNFYTIRYSADALFDMSHPAMLSVSDDVKLAVSSIHKLQHTISHEQPKGCTAKQVFDLYNEMMEGELPQAKILNSTRESNIKARQKDYPKAYDIEWWRLFFEEVKASHFLTGHNLKSWTATFDFLISQKGFNGVVEGKYK